MITIQNQLPTIVGTSDGETYFSTPGMWKVTDCQYLEVMKTNGWGTNIYTAFASVSDGDTITVDGGGIISRQHGPDVPGALFYGFIVGIVSLGTVLIFRWLFTITARTTGMSDPGI